MKKSSNDLLSKQIHISRVRKRRWQYLHESNIKIDPPYFNLGLNLKKKIVTLYTSLSDLLIKQVQVAEKLFFSLSGPTILYNIVLVYLVVNYFEILFFRISIVISTVLCLINVTKFTFREYDSDDGSIFMKTKSIYFNLGVDFKNHQAIYSSSKFTFHEHEKGV